MKNGMTQQEIADIAGMQRTNIVRIESGKYVPTIEVLVKLAVALGMSLEVKLRFQLFCDTLLKCNSSDTPFAKRTYGASRSLRSFFCS